MANIAVIGISGYSAFMPVSEFHKPGETLHSQSFFGQTGGKGHNQALAAKIAGCNVSFLFACGDDSFAQNCKNDLVTEGIDYTAAVKKGETTAFATILTDKHGENRVTVWHGAELEEQDVLPFAEQIKKADILLLQNEVPEQVNLKAAQIAFENNVRVVLNPAPVRPVSQELKKLLWMVTPNETEALALNLKDFPYYCVTLGKKGALLFDGKEEITIPPKTVKAVDTTGAGDAFTGTLCAFIALGSDLKTACEKATAAAAKCVTLRGAKMIKE